MFEFLFNPILWGFLIILIAIVLVIKFKTIALSLTIAAIVIVALFLLFVDFGSFFNIETQEEITVFSNPQEAVQGLGIDSMQKMPKFEVPQVQIPDGKPPWLETGLVVLIIFAVIITVIEKIGGFVSKTISEIIKKGGKK